MKSPSIKELREQGKKKRKDIIYTFMDYLAYYPAKLFLYTPMTANQITVFWIILQFISALFLTSGKYYVMLIAIIFFQLMFILDCSDGIVARYKKQFTLNGIYLDYLGHYINNPTLLIALGIGVANIEKNYIYVFVGVIGALFFLLNKAITLNPMWYSNFEQRKKIESAYSKSTLQNQSKFMYYGFAFFRLEYLFNAMFFGILFSLEKYVLMLYTGLFFLEFVRKVFSQFRQNVKLN